MDELESHCRCNVCFDLFGTHENTPRNLSCGHTFCEGCIERLKQQEVGRNIIKCPTCKNVMYTHTALSINYQILSFANDLRDKKERDVRWSIRRPRKTGLGCGECNEIQAVAHLRVCQSCEEHPVVCPECALTSHNGHSFALYQNFLQAAPLPLPLHPLPPQKHDAEERLVVLGEVVERAVASSSRVLPHTISLLHRLSSCYSSLHVPSSLAASIDRDAAGVIKETERLASSLEGGWAEMEERLTTVAAVAERQCMELEGLGEERRGGEEGDLPVPAPRTRGRRKTLEVAYSEGVSTACVVAGLFLFTRSFPFLSLLLALPLLAWLFFTSRRSRPSEEELWVRE